VKEDVQGDGAPRRSDEENSDVPSGAEDAREAAIDNDEESPLDGSDRKSSAPVKPGYELGQKLGRGVVDTHPAGSVTRRVVNASALTEPFLAVAAPDASSLDGSDQESSGPVKPGYEDERDVE